jgi:hypothetical protein
MKVRGFRTAQRLKISLIHHIGGRRLPDQEVNSDEVEK